MMFELMGLFYTPATNPSISLFQREKGYEMDEIATALRASR
jgi:hypothetical protein